jgi:hypothetical protein
LQATGGFLKTPANRIKNSPQLNDFLGTTDIAMAQKESSHDSGTSLIKAGLILQMYTMILTGTTDFKCSKSFGTNESSRGAHFNKPI